MGKGDTRRPQEINDKDMEERWRRTFGDSGPVDDRRKPPNSLLTDTEG